MAVELESDFEEEEVDVEEVVKMGKRVPRARRYRIRIDRDRYVVSMPFVTKTDLLTLAGKTPDKWRIHQKLHGGQMDEVQDGEEVDLRGHGVERFVTMELAQQDGEAAATEATAVRRAFRLPEEDEEYLDSLPFRWETIEEGKGRWLLIHEYPVPDGFNVNLVTVAVRIEGGYPPAKLDMAYFHPALARSNGKSIPSLSSQSLDGSQYQRWSRHYAWREGIDSLATHYLRIEQWLLDELKR